MNDLDLIRKIKQGHREFEMELFNRYSFMIYKHGKHFRGREDDYKSEAFISFRNAINYFDLNKARDENYKFAKVFWWFLCKQDKEFLKYSNYNGCVSEYNDEVSYRGNDESVAIMDKVALEEKEKLFLPRLTKKNREIYELYVKQEIRDITKLSERTGIDRRVIYYHFKKINSAVAEVS